MLYFCLLFCLKLNLAIQENQDLARKQEANCGKKTSECIENMLLRITVGECSKAIAVVAETVVKWSQAIKY